MIFNVMINGLPVRAYYSQESIDRIFMPLLKHLTDLQMKKKRRLIVFLAAPCAAGKSTLASFLAYLSRTDERLTPICAIGMDGFHRYQDYLTTHTMKRDGMEVMMVNYKGAPETFDLPKLTSALTELRCGERNTWPIYDRPSHNPIEDAVTIDEEIILLEGNYLLLDEPGWNALSYQADYTIKIIADEADLRDRLIDRKIKSGSSKEAAEAFVDRSDLYNAKTVLTKSKPAMLTLMLKADDTYDIGPAS